MFSIGFVHMSKTKVSKTSPIAKEKEDFDPFEFLVDPVRSKILFETLLKGKTTAEMLEKSTKKSKSTISHHLKKLVLSGLLQVNVDPTGKTKYYQISELVEKRGFAFKFDRETLLKASKKEQYEFLINLFEIFSAASHVLANLFSEQIEFLKSNKSFDILSTDEEERIDILINGKRGKMPIHISSIISEDAVKFVNVRIRELIEEVEEKYGPVTKVIKDTKLNPKYLLSFQIFPYFIEDID